MTSEFDLNQLTHYLAGETTPEEARAVEAWLAADARNTAELDKLRGIWGRTGEMPLKVDSVRAWNRLEGRNKRGGVGYSKGSLRRWVIGADAVWKSSKFGVGGYQLKNWGRWLGGVGALTTAVAIITWSFAKTYISTEQVPTSTYVSPVGTRATVTLKDGTRVVLAPATQIRVTGQTVNLTGQALFTVIHKSKSPFTVIAGNTRTVVLGTTFAVRGYPDDTVRVVVAEGRVQLNPMSNYVPGKILGAGEAALVDASGVVSVVSSINLDAALGWANGKMVFDHTSLKNVLEELERTYGTKLTIEDEPLGERKLTGTFSFESLSDALNTLSVLLDVRYARNANGITFMRSRK